MRASFVWARKKVPVLFTCTNVRCSMTNDGCSFTQRAEEMFLFFHRCPNTAVNKPLLGIDETRNVLLIWKWRHEKWPSGFSKWRQMNLGGGRMNPAICESASHKYDVKFDSILKGIEFLQILGSYRTQCSEAFSRILTFGLRTTWTLPWCQIGWYISLREGTLVKEDALQRAGLTEGA